MDVRPYQTADAEALVALWRAVFPDDGAHNEAGRMLRAKLQVDDAIYLAWDGDRLLGAVMAGYDGHRGWLYAVAVAEDARRRGVGAALVRFATASLRRLGCVKVNLQVRSHNQAVVGFYRSLGFQVEDRISMGRLIADDAAQTPG